MQRIFQQSYHVPGTLSANLNIRFTVPCDCQLLHVSAVASNASSATLILGDSADDNEYLTIQNVGDSNVPAEFDGDDFVDADGVAHGRYYPHIADGTVFVATVDYDGTGGTAAQNFTLVLTFAEG